MNTYKEVKEQIESVIDGIDYKNITRKPMMLEDIAKEHMESTLDQLTEEEIRDYIKDGELHFYCFNEDYVEIYTYTCKQNMKGYEWEIIEEIKNYEQDNFGEVTTDLSDPFRVFNMWMYIVGETLCSEYEEEFKANDEREEEERKAN